MLILPIKTDRPRIRPAYLTILLIAVCTLIHVYGVTLPLEAVTVTIAGKAKQDEMNPLVRDFGLWSATPTLLAFFSHQFLHGDWMHLIGNMLFLWIFGSLIEDAIRPWGLAALYLGGGVMAALAHLGISGMLGNDSNVPMIGASGAIAAIMGLFMLRFYRTRVEMFYWFGWWVRGTFWVQSVWALAIWVTLEVIGGVLSAGEAGGGVAHWAHVGGFVAGAVAAPFVGGISGARKEYVTDDPDTNVEYVRRSEQVAAAEKALKGDPGNAYLIRKLAQAFRYAGDYEDATSTYQRCVCRFATRGMMEQAMEVYLELMQYNDAAAVPPEVRLSLAKELEHTRVEQAAWSYRFLAEHHPARPEGEYALLRLAALYQGPLEQPYEAARCLYDFLQRYPSSQWAAEARQTYDRLYQQLQARQA